MIPIEELKAAISSPLCHKLAKSSPALAIQELRRLRYPASDQKLNDWDWLRSAFHVDYLYVTGWQDGWRGGGLESNEGYRYHASNADLVAGQIAGRLAHMVCYGKGEEK